MPLIRHLTLHNRQRAVPVDLRFLRRLTLHALETCLDLEGFHVGILLVGPRAMARANMRFLDHEGPTDVITFDYAPDLGIFGGEILVCPAVARLQAREFNTSWQTELARYVVHGLLHLRGYDDTTSALRRRMKREEGRVLRQLAGRFPLDQLG